MRTSPPFLGAALLPLVAVAAWAQEPAPLGERDLRKLAVELPVKHGLLDSGAAPVERGADPARVLPGRVAWHASPEAALEVARASGKPVLLFQLLGRLDDELC